MLLVSLSVAPVLIILIFIYLKDKYEKEPLKLLIFTLFLGCLTPIPVLIVDAGWEFLGGLFTFTHYGSVFYDSFIVAGFTEELFKFLVLILFIWKNKNFDEKFDGIVYAAFVSLGFALVENILYVLSGGAGVALIRAFTAVPAHALFGITMGYFFGLARFNDSKKNILLLSALLIPILVHGFYDFILMSENGILLLAFIPFMIIIFVLAFQMIKSHTNNSKYNPKNMEVTNE